MRTLVLLALPALVGLTACPTDTVDPIDLLVDDSCEATNPRHCMLPWPSARWLEADGSTETGYRLEYDPAGIPLNQDDAPFDSTEYERRDGFSPASMMLTTFAQAPDWDATDGTPHEGMWDISTLATSPTMIIDLETGALIPHMVENDLRAGIEGRQNYDTMVYIRPAKRLEENRSYGVAIRNVVLEDGTMATAFPGFAALRDGVITNAAQIEDQRDGYEQLFTAIEAAGWDRAELVQAWRFHTASGDNLRGDLLSMRDDAMARIEADGAQCTVESVQTDVSEQTWARLDGTFRIPLYMDSPERGARVVRGADGHPAFQGWATAPFTMLVPRRAVEPGAERQRLLQFGHGLMGAGDGEGGGGFLRGFGQEFGFVTVATDWQGMSEDDFVTVGRALTNMAEFPKITERLMQGVVNNLVLTRSFLGDCQALPDLQHEGHSVIGDSAWWLGISQGGIMGGTLMALSQDFEAGALLVGGMSYPVMVGRSVDFTLYEDLFFHTWYEDRIDREFLFNMSISLWDIAEPNAFLPHLVSDPLPDTPPKRILYQIAKDDSQVPNLASDMAARTMGIPLLTPSAVTPWGLETTEGPVESAMVYFDLLATPHPEGNWVPEDDNGAHGEQRYLDAARIQMNEHLSPKGQIRHTCDGPCDPE